eukprot:TRINITY_DN6392_c2_g1_i1.p1 TRINITY_DN6392_c2_g1~~TRINITY_DN6392_c2_g1_i1.p1  ORF type:complete len:250 (+),score=92.89 TRINITY_DN6392_c2_g1_i1:355-1104(+)
MPASMFVPPETREETIFMSKICEQANRFSDMVICLKKAIKQNSELSPEERNLLAVAYKQLLSDRRVAWRILSSAEQREEKKGNRDHAKLVGGYRRLIEREITDICQEKLNLLDTSLIPNAQSVEEQVFYLKHKGDYHRYHAEVGGGDAYRENAHEAYSKASDLAFRSLTNTHPMKLGLALNFAVFTVEILRQHDKGVDIAKRAFDAAVSELESLDEDSYREATALMQLLRDNLTLWAEESLEEDPDKAG